MRYIPEKSSFFIRNAWTIPHVVLHPADKPGEYKAKISKWMFGFYLPYLSHEPIDVEGQPEFPLAIADLGHACNWAVCRAIDKRRADITDLGVAEVHVLKEVGVIRTDYCGELLVSGLVQKMDCLFV